MQINFEHYVNLLQGLCSLNIYIGFEIEFSCRSQVPTDTTNHCDVKRITPIRIRNTPRECTLELPSQMLSMVLQNGTQKRHCFTHYCRKRQKRFADQNETNSKMDYTNERKSTTSDKSRSLVKSTAFGNPSLPQPPRRNKKRRPPKTKPKETG